MFEVKMPQLGLTMTEGIVTRWYKKEGDTVKKGEILYEVETDKLTNEVECEADGILHKIVAAEGSEIVVLGLLAIIGDEGEQIELASAVSNDREPVASLEAIKSTAVTEVNHATNQLGVQTGGRIKASPLAKKIAAEKGIELVAVNGTGPNGRIVRRDVLLATTEPQPVMEMATATMTASIYDQVSTPSSTQVTSSFVNNPSTRRGRMSAMRRAISRNMSYSWSVAPVVHYHRSVDTTALTELKQTLSQDDLKISYTDILAKIVANVLMEYPHMNATVDGEDMIYHDYVNLGIAVALEEGLVVPVIRDAHHKGIGAISQQIKELAGKARTGTLAEEEMSDGTFTITNIGMFGMENFTPIINQPESAILGIGSIVKTAVEVEGQIVMQPRMYLSMTADHRAIDGAVAAQFMQRVCSIIEAPWRLLL
jgi:pyruvate dehydrogenase E2 component (dihydrolipoamide acetyltransferase)